jgi:hypothetical protein
MAWKQIGGNKSGYTTFTTPGDSVAGTFCGTRMGQYGNLVVMKTGQGEITFPLYSALSSRLEDVPEGAAIKVIYNGEQVAKKSGRTFKAFTVYQDVDVDDTDPIPL